MTFHDDDTEPETIADARHLAIWREEDELAALEAECAREREVAR